MISILDIPFLSRAIGWGDAKLREAIEAIVRRYAEFERAALEAPAIEDDASHVVRVFRTTGGTPQQISQAEQYQVAAQKLAQDVANRGPVDQVMEWLASVKRGSGMGALPVVPVAIVGAVGVAGIIVASALKSYNDAKVVRMMIEMGATPAQVAALATRKNPFASGLFGATSAVTLIAVGVGAYVLLKAFRGS